MMRLDSGEYLIVFVSRFTTTYRIRSRLPVTIASSLSLVSNWHGIRWSELTESPLCDSIIRN